MIVVTSGSKYIDIDAYASCIAYANLLNLKGKEAKAVSSAKTNESIPSSLLKLNIGLDNYKPSKEDEFIIIDVSNKAFFDKFVNEDKIIEVIDHHVGYEEYWRNKLQDKAKIEFLGSVATVIVELYEKEGFLYEITKELAILLISAILDNTLNLKAKVTSKRDRVVYEKLERIIQDKKYSEKYFLECQLQINKDLKLAIENDTKTEYVNSRLPPIFSQLTIWDKEEVLRDKDIIYTVLNNIGNKWMLNLICLKDGKSYVIAQDLEVQKNLEKLFNKKFNADIMELDSVWLRKEIMKIAQEEKNMIKENN